MNWRARSKPEVDPADGDSVSASSSVASEGLEDPHPGGNTDGSASAHDRSFVGDRGASSLSGNRSLQSRITNVLAAGLISTLALGLLGWYYARTAAQPSVAKHAAQSAVQQKGEGDLPLPPLGKIDPPKPMIEQVLGSAPIDLQPTSAEEDWAKSGQHSPNPYSAAQQPPKTPEQLALERQLGGPVSVSRSSSSQLPGGPTESSNTGNPAATLEGRADGRGNIGPPAASGAAIAGGESALGARLRPTVTPAVGARVLPTQRLLLPKGAFIDCTLETAINSALPGMTTCITATDTFGADGQVVLLERGTKLTGETGGTVQRGAARVFVLWIEARTPTGVVIPLASPGTDELGRVGLSGKINRHFWERFGAAILITMIDGAVQGAVASQSNGGTVIYSPTTSQDITTEVLKSTVDISPTIEKKNGDRIQILVARDLDFRSVYELKSTAAAR
jgi:type IV secretion system protein VirB10